MITGPAAPGEGPQTSSGGWALRCVRCAALRCWAGPCTHAVRPGFGAAWPRNDHGGCCVTGERSRRVGRGGEGGVVKLIFSGAMRSNRSGRARSRSPPARERPGPGRELSTSRVSLGWEESGDWNAVLRLVSDQARAIKGIVGASGTNASVAPLACPPSSYRQLIRRLDFIWSRGG